MPLSNTRTDVFHGAPLPAHDWEGSFISGHEPVRELRILALRLSASCPQNLAHARCPFRLIESLSPEKRRHLISRMNRNALLQLFAMEHACRREAAMRGDPCCSAFLESGLADGRV